MSFSTRRAGFAIAGLVMGMLLLGPVLAAEPAAPAAAAPVEPGPKLNEMRGKLQSKSADPRTLRLTVDGGFNVEFSYDAHTSSLNGGKPVQMDDLSYGDELIVRYSGKEMRAIEIERVNKAVPPL